MPRRAELRLQVSAGSVGIGGAHTSVYPLSMPGGCQLSGLTSLKLFDPMREPLVLLRPSDSVRFMPQEGGRVLNIIHAGICTTVQDSRRHGFRQPGLSYCSTLDKPACQTANTLVGNSADASTLEITLGQLVVKFENDNWFAFTGAGCEAQLYNQPVWIGW